MLRRVSGRIFLGLFLAAAHLMQATPSQAEECPAHLLDGVRPSLVDARLSPQTLPLCFSAFTILYSGTSRTPLYAAEHLTRQSVFAARAVDRLDAFHDEERLPEEMRARLDDYVRSGFDRGHMAPAGDMPTPEAQSESFSLANIVPQERSLNRTLWAAIEESVRRLAIERGSLYVVTGPVFQGAEIRSINGRVLVPTHLFKAVYDPKRREGAAYLAPNVPDAEWRQISLSELAKVVGIDAFPRRPIEAAMMTLPEPRAYSRDGETRRDGRREDSIEAWLYRSLERFIRYLAREILRAIF